MGTPLTTKHHAFDISWGVPDGNELKARADRICSAAYVIICCINDVADTAMEDAITQLKQSRLYRNSVKWHAKEAQRKYAAYQYKLKDTLSGSDRWQFWMDFADQYQEQAAIHVLKLRLAFEQALINHHMPLSELRSYVLTAETMLSMAVMNFDEYFKEMNEKHGIDLRELFLPARIEGVRHHFAEVANAILNEPSMPGVDINLNTDDRCLLAFRCLETQLLSPDFINRAGGTVIEEFYPQYAKEQ